MHRSLRVAIIASLVATPAVAQQAAVRDLPKASTEL
jgi:hypothetical protein